MDDKLVTRTELKEEISATRIELKEEISGIREEIAGLEVRIQTQFEAQDQKLDEKLAMHHNELVSKLDFLIEQAQVDKYDVLETQIVDHEQRISDLEKR